MAMEPETSDVATKLRLRLKEMTTQKEDLLKSINELNEELQKLFAKAPKKPRESLKELDDEIAALEFKRTTSSLILADESMILRQIAFLQRAKTQVVERQAHEETIRKKKAELSELRDSLTVTLAAIDELLPVLSKVELAKKLSCTAAEIKTITIEYPQEKTRHVIGKNGSTIKQIMEKAHVTMDVDSDKGQIELSGSESALERAIYEINKITQAIDEHVEVSPALVAYLSARRLTAFAEIREQHPDVYFDVDRNATSAHLEGLPDDVAAAKSALLSLDVKQESRSLTSQEAGVVVGKKGANINHLVDEHKVTIDVHNSNEGYTVTLIGPSANVEAALSKIDELLEINKEITECVNVDIIVRGALLNDGGARMKLLQKEINEKTKDNGGSVFLTIEKDSSVQESSLLVKGRRPAVTIALEVLNQFTKDIMDSVVVILVDPYIVPRIIGKGGSHIKEMKKQGNGVIIEVDKSGKIELYGSNADDVEAVAEIVRKVVEDNQVARLDFDPSAIILMFRALVRAKSKEINSIVTGMELDEDASQIVLRGSTENIKTASDMIVEFMANNYVEEVEFAPEEESALLMGGATCTVNKMGKEFEVEMSVARSNHVVAIRGKKENVMTAKKRLTQFLHGGDGHSVSKIVVSEQAVGAVIGKGGSRRAELEATHEGVSIFIERSNGIVTLRGPDEKVQDCRTDILRIVSSIRVTESMPISSEQHEELSKPDAVRRVTNGIPVQVTVTENAVGVRGIFSDVRDALALLKAHLTGVYEARITLDPQQFAKVSGASRDASHFNRIIESTSAEIELDSYSDSIVISGKRANVKKAKILMMGFLDFLLPSHFEHMKIPKVFHSTVANAASLADVAALSGASVVLDRDLNSIQMQSSDPDKLKAAVKIMKAKIVEAEKLMFVMQIDTNDAWLIPAIIGKGGSQIKALSTETGCRIDVSKQESTITVTGEDEESVAKARESLDAVIDRARRECVFVQLPSGAVPAFLGKSGGHIQNFAEEHGVEVERFRKEQSKLKITGPEDSVSAAHAALLDWISIWEESTADVTIPVEKSMIPAVIGNKGSVINALQKESGCRIDIDRDSSTLTVRGSTGEKRNEVIKKIIEIIAENEAVENEREEKKERDAEERLEKTKAEKSLPVAAPPAEDSNTDSRKHRKAEFAPRPIGLSNSGGGSPKLKKGRNRSKSKPDAPLTGTAAGRDLCSLLLSNAPTSENASGRMDTPTPLLLSKEEHRDTLSDSSSTDIPAENGTMYYKSASGFTVRV